MCAIMKDAPVFHHLLRHVTCRAIIQTLIHRGADVNGRDNIKRTPLHHAAANSYNTALVISALLHQHTADVNAQNNAGNTSLLCFIKEGVKFRAVLQAFLARRDCSVEVQNH